MRISVTFLVALTAANVGQMDAAQYELHGLGREGTLLQHFVVDGKAIGLEAQ